MYSHSVAAPCLRFLRRRCRQQQNYSCWKHRRRSRSSPGPAPASPAAPTWSSTTTPVPPAAAATTTTASRPTRWRRHCPSTTRGHREMPTRRPSASCCPLPGLGPKLGGPAAGAASCSSLCVGVVHASPGRRRWSRCSRRRPGRPQKYPCCSTLAGLPWRWASPLGEIWMHAVVLRVSEEDDKIRNAGWRQKLILKLVRHDT